MAAHTQEASITSVRPGQLRRCIRSAAACVALIWTSLIGIPTAPATVTPPEGRGYELVSPVDKNGRDITDGELVQFQEDHGVVASDDGNTVTFTSPGSFANSPSAGLFTTYLARRADDGWSTEAISPRQGTGLLRASVFHGFSTDLSFSVLTSTPNPPLAPGAARNAENLYLRDSSTGSYALLTTGVPDDSEDFEAEYVGASNDFETVMFGAELPLTIDAPTGVDPLLYQWEAGALSLIGYLPDGSISSDDVESARPGSAPADMLNAVSDDGERVFFYTPTSGSQRQLYVRVGGSTTQHVSASRRIPPDPNGTEEADFELASTDGSVAYFASQEKLTDDATTGPTSGGRDLYRYEVETDTLTDITVDEFEPAPPAPDDDPNGASVQGILGASDDGNRVYFAAMGALAPGATAGQRNLYAWEDNGTGFPTTTFIATLASGDASNWTANIANRTSRVTPDGRYLAFESEVDLAGAGTGGLPQVYLYDADSQELECASCDPGGDPPGGPARLTANGNRRNIVRHNLSDDGSRLFFESPDPLVPEDSNRAVDVYVYEGGKPHLISTGTASSNALFQDASVDGDDVFFTTRQQLVASDNDNLIDLYDARVGGGFRDAEVPAPCEADSCQGTSSPPPAWLDPSTSTFSGPGNPGAGDTRSVTCDRVQKQVKNARRKAKQLKRRARHASGANAKRLARKYRKAKHKAKRARKAAMRCRRRPRQ